MTVTSEPRRKCGFRHVGGLYLVGGKLSAVCGRLPYPLNVCPVCGQGVKYARGYTSIDWRRFAGKCLESCDCHRVFCPVCLPRDCSYGIIWVGVKHYTPDEFIQEAAELGISRRINTIPRAFDLGSTWILFASKQAMPEDPEDPKADRSGIFASFKPTRIETLVRESDATEENLEKLRKRNITPVVVPDDWEQRHHGKSETRDIFSEI